MNEYTLEQFSLRRSITGVVYEVDVINKLLGRKKPHHTSYSKNSDGTWNKTEVSYHRRLTPAAQKVADNIKAATALGGLGLGGHLMHKGYQAATGDE